MAKRTYLATCPKRRRWLETTSSVDMMTGETSKRSEQWVEGPCGAPLFSRDSEAGMCRSCASGWKCDTNYPLEDN